MCYNSIQELSGLKRIIIFVFVLESQNVLPIILTAFPTVVGAVLVILPGVIDIYKGSPDFTIVAYAAVSTNPLISMEVGLVDVEDLTQMPNMLNAGAAFAAVASANSQVSFCVL